MLKSFFSQSKSYSEYILKHYCWEPHPPRLLWGTKNVLLDSLGDALLTQEIVKCKARHSICMTYHFGYRGISLSEIISVIRNTIFDHVLLPAGWEDLLGEPGGHLHEGEKPAGGLTNLFSQEKKEKTTTVYEMEEAWMLKKKTVRRSIWRWRCLWDRVSD